VIQPKAPQTTMNTLSLLFVLAWSVSAIKYKTQSFDLPAYETAGNGGVSSRGETIRIPEFKNRIGILYWGGWEVVDADTNKVMPTGHVFFHHITVFRDHKNGEREFLTGCSDDRRTLGPDLADGYLQLIDIPNDPKIEGYYHLVNLMPHKVKMAVRYNITYVADEDIPDNTVWLKAHFLSTAYNVPGNGGFGSVHTQVTDVQAPVSGKVITVVGHLHQGSKNVTMVDKKTQKPLFHSKAIYAEGNENDKCFYAEWCAQSGKPLTRNRVKDLELTRFKQDAVGIVKDSLWQMISYYDNGAEYRTVMAWLVIFVQEDAAQ